MTLSLTHTHTLYSYVYSYILYIFIITSYIPSISSFNTSNILLPVLFQIHIAYFSLMFVTCTHVHTHMRLVCYSCVCFQGSPFNIGNQLLMFTFFHTVTCCFSLLYVGHLFIAVLESVFHLFKRLIFLSVNLKDCV